MNARALIPRGSVDAPAEEGFEGWVRASSPRLRRVAYLLTGDLHQAEDLLLSAYAKDSPEASQCRTRPGQYPGPC